MSVATESRLLLSRSGQEQFRWSALTLPPCPVNQLEIVLDQATMRQALRQQCPALPGIYGFFDHTGQLIYVGYSAKLLNRLTTYFQKSQTSRKEQRIASRASRLMWENVGHPFVAMHRELEIIQQFQPRLNVRGRSRRQKLGFLLQTSDEAPRFAIRKLVPKGTKHWWGPLWIDKSLRESVEKLNQAFLLPDCPRSTKMAFKEQHLLTSQTLYNPCLRAETGSCLAPCGGTCTRVRYFDQLRAARELLEGKCDSILVAMEKRISEAAQALRFEQAARLRDTLQQLDMLQHRLQVARKPSYQNGVYQVRVHGRRVWFLLVGSVVEGSVSEPLSTKLVIRFLDLLNQFTAGRLRKSTQKNRLASQIVNLWFRRYPEEMEKVMTYEAAKHFFSSKSRNSQGLQPLGV